VAGLCWMGGPIVGSLMDDGTVDRIFDN